MHKAVDKIRVDQGQPLSVFVSAPMVLIEVPLPLVGWLLPILVDMSKGSPLVAPILDRVAVVQWHVERREA